MKSNIGIKLGIIAAIVALSCFVAINSDKVVEEVPTSPYHNFTKDVGEDIHISRSGYYGIDFVSIGNCRIVKRKLGRLTLGVFNVLQLDKVDVILPPPAVGAAKEKAAEIEEKDSKISAASIASRVGIGDKSLSSFIGKAKFSGLEITDFTFSTLDEATNVVRRFSAKKAAADREGLKLKTCLINTPEGEKLVDSARLKVKPELKLVWPSGEMTFN